MPSFSIGNDVVDLHEDTAPVHERFADRVFTSEEKKRITSRENFWLYWAAKEAAYKMLKRLIPKLVYSPAGLVFNHYDSTICYDGVKYPCAASSNKNYVSVVCAASKKGFETHDLRSWLGVRATTGLNESQEVRKFAARRIGVLLGINEKMLGFTNDRIPALTISGKKTNDLLSFSHHGKYLLCSYFKCCTA